MIKLTSPDGLPVWIVAETVETLRPTRATENLDAQAVLHFTSGMDLYVKESVEELLVSLTEL